jgi:hypothetical protein
MVCRWVIQTDFAKVDHLDFSMVCRWVIQTDFAKVDHLDFSMVCHWVMRTEYGYNWANRKDYVRECGWDDWMGER